jgi:nucleotide-binding universal stress UspA family protein
MKRVVVGVDESMGAAEALRWAVREAELRGGEVDATMAWGFLDQHHRVVDDIAFDERYDERAALAALDGYVVAVTGAGPSVPVQRRVVRGQAASVLLAAAERADLLVVGARGLGGFRGLLLGSVSLQCLHHAPCPIAVVHGHPATGPGPEPERIVVGVDGSAHAQRALEWAVEESRLRGALLDVVLAWSYPTWAPPPHGAPGLAYTNIGRYEAMSRRTLDGAVQRVDARGLVRPPERILAMGGAAGTILDVAKGADLVVVGARGRGGSTRQPLGSVSQQVATHADCPVVVIPRSG